MQVRRELQDDPAREFVLQVFAVFVELGKHGVGRLFAASQDAHKDVGVLEVGRDVDVLNGDKLGKRQLATDQVAEFAFHEFSDSDKTVLHGIKWEETRVAGLFLLKGCPRLNYSVWVNFSSV